MRGRWPGWDCPRGWSFAPRASWPSTFVPRRTPTGWCSTSPAGTRCTATVPSYGRFFEQRGGQAYVLRVASTFMLQLAAQTRMTCAQAVKQLGRHTRRWEVRSAGAGSKGQRWYAWMWIATASPRHHLLVRRPLQRGELAFHYCYVPEG